MPYRISTRWCITLGCVALVVSLAFYMVHGFILIDYDDRGHGEWDWELAEMWLATLPIGIRVVFWITLVAAPVASVIGITFIAIGIFRFFNR